MMHKAARWGLWMTLGAVSMAAAAAHAQAPGVVEGTWQGTLHPKKGDVRVVLRISRGADGRLGSEVILPDQKGSMRADETTVTGDTVTVDMNADDASFTGKLSPDGTSLAGTYTEHDSIPLVLVRATPETAWPLPEPEKEPAAMDPKADPSFEVATIKPTRPDAQNTRFSLEGAGHFYIGNQPLTTILQIVYGMHKDQIAGLPDWAGEQRWDIDTKSDTPGMPTWDQVNIMMKKLLAERFGLQFHTEQREMPAFVLSVAKGGHKMKPSHSPSPLHDTTGHGRGQLSVTNATMKDLCLALETGMVDRPVVDRTGLGDQRFNFQIHWTPDDGKPSNPDGNPFPPLLVALPEEVGLKLEATKTAVPVMVIDRVTKPTAN